MCERAAETTNSYERHRIFLMYHLFVSLLLREVKDGLGGAWAFVLRDIIYTLIHHINSRLVRAENEPAVSRTLCGHSLYCLFLDKVEPVCVFL